MNAQDPKDYAGPKGTARIKDIISDLPDDIVAQLRRSLSGMERNTTTVITIKGSNGGKAMYLIGRDLDGHTFSNRMNREEGLDSGIVFGN
jgi:hypothetical protein